MPLLNPINFNMLFSKTLIGLGVFFATSIVLAASSSWDESSSISANPASTNIMAGSGALQKAFEQVYGIKKDNGIRVGANWIVDINELFAGGTPHAKNFSANNSFQLSLSVDGEKMSGWQGALFDIELLQFNGQNTNSDAGSVQDYNSLPGAPPLNRTELYQLWYRQALFNQKFVFRVGKTVPNMTFNNVVKPVPLKAHTIPAVSGLIYTPIFVNPTMLGVLPGYYNSAYGLELSLTPSDQWYLSAAVYDGSLAQGVQTGLKAGPTFNGTYFYIGETGITWVVGKNQQPGYLGVGAWHQAGLIEGEQNLSEKNASGFYLFGSQRVWYKHPGINYSGISTFYQYGLNNSDVLRMNQYVGTGLTAFGLIPNRMADSFGAGLALSWLNQRLFSRRTETIFQFYYQAKLLNNIYLEPVLSYIPSPGEGTNLPQALAGTLRLIVGV